MNRPDLTHFKIAAKIDWIKVGGHKLIMARASKYNLNLLNKYFDGTAELPRRNPDLNTGWLTIHDPTTRDLNRLLEAVHTAEIRGLEVAIDFVPQQQMSQDQLLPVYLWLRHSLCPQRHAAVETLKTVQWSDPADTYVPLRTLRYSDEPKTFLWTANRGTYTIRLYIKERHRDKTGEHLLAQPFVRVEVSITRGGLQRANLSKVGLLPRFGKELRSHLAPFFSIAQGLKLPRGRRFDRWRDPEARRAAEAERRDKERKLHKKWERYGAAYARRHRLAYVPDPINRVIERQLTRLGAKLTRLRPPQNVSHFNAIEQEFYLGKFPHEPPSYRRSNQSRE